MTTEPDVFEGDPFDPEFVRKVEKAEREGVEDSDEKVKTYVARRANAYKAVFKAGKRSQADIDIVLTDLAAFCRSEETRYHPDRTLSDMLEGRAEVFYRIRNYVRLSADTLYLMLTDAKTKIEQRTK